MKIKKKSVEYTTKVDKNLRVYFTHKDQNVFRFGESCK